MFSSTQIEALQSALVRWQKCHGRHDLPWQQPRTPYRVWVSEIMLQQTQVTKVRDYFQRFIERFPSVSALAAASEEDVLSYWSGLGYYARARNLHRAAREIMRVYDGQLPDTLEALVQLPGIGRSTAGAILALGHGKRGVILDGNVKRVLARLLALKHWPGDTTVEKQLWQVAEQLTPHHDIVAFVQGWMDLGAMICRKGRPQCDICPWSHYCRARQCGIADQLPVPRPKRSKSVEHWYLAVIRNQHEELALIKRPRTGVWGGLFCFPLVTKAQAQRVIAQETHVLTHKKLELHFVEVTSPPLADWSVAWYHADKALSLGLPAPIKRFLQRENEL